MSIYVEIRIRGTMDEIWRLTQTPDLHERWDLRFTSIAYLNRSGNSESQRFRYSTRKLSDAARLQRIVDQAKGRRLSYKPLTDGVA